MTWAPLEDFFVLIGLFLAAVGATGATVLVPPYSYTVREVTHTGDGALKRLRMTRQ